MKPEFDKLKIIRNRIKIFVIICLTKYIIFFIFIIYLREIFANYNNLLAVFIAQFETSCLNIDKNSKLFTYNVLNWGGRLVGLPVPEIRIRHIVGNVYFSLVLFVLLDVLLAVNLQTLFIYLINILYWLILSKNNLFIKLVKSITYFDKNY